MPFSILWNAGVDHDPPKTLKAATANILPNFGEAIKNPDLAVVSVFLRSHLKIWFNEIVLQKYVLREQQQRKNAWWKSHARLQAPDKVPCDTLCEIIKRG